MASVFRTLLHLPGLLQAKLMLQKLGRIRSSLEAISPVQWMGEAHHPSPKQKRQGLVHAVVEGFRSNGPPRAIHGYPTGPVWTSRGYPTPDTNATGQDPRLAGAGHQQTLPYTLRCLHGLCVVRFPRFAIFLVRVLLTRILTKNSNNMVANTRGRRLSPDMLLRFFPFFLFFLVGDAIYPVLVPQLASPCKNTPMYV